MVGQQRAAGCRSLGKIAVARVLRTLRKPRYVVPLDALPLRGVPLFHPAEGGRLGTRARTTM